ncbi:MAG: autotransporter-associated beta strand repeat-containing protein, partial [Chthoniobacteraceae bacterium]
MNRSHLQRWVVAILIGSAAALVWWQPPRALPPAPRPTVAAVPELAPIAVQPLSKPVVAAAKVEPPRAQPVPTDVVLPMRQDLRWQTPMQETVFAGFRDWTTRFAKARTDAEKAALIGEGLALVEERRNQMADLIDQNPRRALELAVPETVRRQLPAEIVAQLEQSVSGRGDLFVVAAVPAPGRSLKVRPIERTVKMADGREFAAFTFGLRDTVPTREGVAVQGVALDGKLALTELPGRVLEPVEVADRRAAGAGTPVCPTSGLVTSITNDEVVVDWDGSSHTFFCGPQHALESLYAAALDEAMLGGSGGGGGGGAVTQSAATEGTKKLLIIRVDFPDAPGQVVSDATLTTLINNMLTHWTEMSFGKMTWTAIGAGSDFTPTLRLPNNHASYTGFSTMLAAARTAATAAGYNYTNYTHEVVVTGDKPDVSFGGVAYVGARGAWLANSQWNLGVCSHEVGHNFGLNHSGFWDTDDGTVIGSGAAVEYGNPFDQMGGASSSMNAHFGARQKNYLDWIADADVVKITTDGTTTTRIRAFDKTAATSKKAIAVDRTGTSNDYWIEYRQTYAGSNVWMKDGVVLNWGDVGISNMKPLLLDNAPATSTKDDSAVLIGRTFSDTAAGIHITPVLRGSDVDGTSWIDVTVNRGPFTGNQKPSVMVNASNLNPAVNASVTFTAAGSDPDGDTLGYHWDWGDGTFTANNSTTAAKSWSTSGTKTVRCYVTDMKGQTTTGQLLVQVGTSSTFFIQGTVATTLGVPVSGAVVKASATQTDTTDSEGYYAITGLAAGSYTMTATKTGLTIQPGSFTNPVTVGPNQQNMNFTAPPGSPYFGTMKAGLVDAGSNTGAVIVPVNDADTPVTSLTLTGTSSNQAIIPDANIVFGTVGTTVRTVTVTAPSNVGGVVNITITAMDPESGTGTYVWPVTVNAKPVLALSTKTTPENTPIDIDLRTFVTDDLTPTDKIAYEVSRARDGTVTVLPDGYTARFTPTPGYNGAASFRLVVRDQSLGPRTLLLYDFEPPDVATDAKSTDVSNFNRTGTLEIAGVGGEYNYNADVPPLVAPYGTQSLGLSEAGTGAARLRRTLAATDLDYNDSDWSFSAWVNRATRTSEDFIFHLGTGDGNGTEAELQLYFPANSDALKVGKYGAAGLEKEIVGPNVPIGEWHHITLTYDRTATNLGTLALYVDGFLAGSVASVTMDVSQSASLSVGGTGSTAASLDRWFDGSLDDVLLQSGLNSRTETWFLAKMGTRHYNGLTASGTVSVTVSGANQAPSITSVPDVIMPVGGASAPLPFVVADAEAEDRNLTVSPATTNASVLPVSGIAVSAAPAAWSSGNIGSPTTAGSLTQDHGTFLMAGAGTDIGGTADQCRWTAQALSGDGEIIARVASMDFTNVDAKAGVMMRQADTDTAPYAFAFVTPGNGVAFHYRATDGAAAAVNAAVNWVAAPCWLRLVRTGSNFNAYHATDNNGVAGAWQPIGTTQAVTFTTSPNTYGLAVTSKSAGTANTVVFDRLGGTVKLGGERTVTLTPTPGASGSAMVTLTASDGSATAPTAFNVLVDGAPPSTSVWNATTAGSLLWSAGTNWSGGTPPPSSRFSTVEFFTGQTFTAGAVTASNDTTLGHALNVLTLGGTGPTTGTSTVAITGNPVLFRQEAVLAPVVNLSATNGTGLTYDVSAPITLETGITFQGNGTATFIFSGIIDGPGGLTKTGTSKLILTGENSYLGTTTINAGILQIGNDDATGSLPAGDVINNATLRIDRTGTVLVPNNISGTGGLTINNPSSAHTVVLSGANSFTGNVAINSGSVRIRAANNLGAGTKNITTQSTTARLLLDGSAGDIVLPASFTLVTSNPNGAVINESGSNTILGNVTISSGGGDTRLTVAAGSLVFEGSFSLNTTSRNLVFAGAGTGSINGNVSDGTVASRVLGVTKNDAGTWTLAGANTYSGTTTISAGTLRLGSSTALGNGGSTFGSATGGTSITSGATLEFNGQQAINEVLTIRGTGVGGAGGVVNNSPTPASIADGVVSSISTTAGGVHSAAPAVAISGSGSGAAATATLGVSAASFTINGGTTVYSAAPTATISGGGGTGATATAVLTGGVVSGITITNPGSGFTTAPTIAFSAGTVSTAGTNPTGTGNAANFVVSAITVTSAGSGYTSPPTVSFDTGSGTTATANLSTVILGANTSIGGTGDIVFDAPVAGAFTLTKIGSGTLTLNGANTYAGTTTVSAGVLKGSGSIAGSLTVTGGTHAPGNSAGIMSVAGNYTLAAGGTLQAEISGPAAGTQYDQLALAGGGSVVALAGALD